MKESTFQDYNERMLRVLVHIQQRLDEELSLEEMAGVACFSPYHFHRIFRGMVGESVQGHVRRLRLERAANRLKHAELSVTKIALEAGYETPAAFTRAFKAMTGLAPAAFRSYHRAMASAASAPPAPEDAAAVEARGGDMEVRIERWPDLRVAFVRHVGPYDRCGDAWDRLLPFLGKEGLLAGEVRFVGVCHDDPEVTPPERIRYDACVTVDDGFEPAGEIGVQVIPGGEYAVTAHVGPYHRLEDTYAKLMGQWLPRSGREARSAPCLEVYLNSPEDTDPEDLVTDVCAPLEPREGGR